MENKDKESKAEELFDLVMSPPPTRAKVGAGMAAAGLALMGLGHITRPDPVKPAENYTQTVTMTPEEVQNLKSQWQAEKDNQEDRETSKKIKDWGTAGMAVGMGFLSSGLIGMSRWRRKTKRKEQEAAGELHANMLEAADHATADRRNFTELRPPQGRINPAKLESER